MQAYFEPEQVHLSIKLIASNSDIDEAFISMYLNVMTKINYASEN